MRTWLINIREEAVLTQEEVAKKAGIARATYGHIETGERGITVANAKKISGALGFHWTIFLRLKATIRRITMRQDSPVVICQASKTSKLEICCDI